MHKDVVHQAVWVFLRRMIVCLGENVLTLMPDALGSMLDVDNCGYEDLMQFIPLVNQLVGKFKEKVTPLLNAVFMPLTRATLGLLGSSVDPTDVCTLNDHSFLQRSYFEFLNGILANGLSRVLISEQNAPDAPEVLLTVLQISSFSDQKGQRILLGMFKQLIAVWFAQGTGLDGFDDFVLSDVVPHSFQCVMHPDNDPEDAWSRLMVGEVASILVAAFRNSGPSFLAFLETSYFPSVDLPPDAAEAVLELVQGGNVKALQQGLVEMAKALRS
jgi:exportin-T